MSKDIIQLLYSEASNPQMRMLTKISSSLVLYNLGMSFMNEELRLKQVVLLWLEQLYSFTALSLCDSSRWPLALLMS